ncbi:protein phosphatase [Homoserinimonas aerilata]|uniref:Protein phosphatase n=1 Tax=Homoserinimonas aerilata TaxID=1162970 RepID=A0A542XWZ5_9MICO|nr:PP2C family serine/threonine-protein phosphatase [Homoserinimonas aerilata]TQL40354.1 protein phosphatase [Homoserinimonas aerilata]
MATTIKSAAVSHVGRIRSNNQDSGYAGRQLFVVADGMGGHAGGDVASAIALKRIIEADRPFASAHDAEFALQSALLSANGLLAETVFDHPELTGMGTTATALLRVGDHVAIAHIGDSRLYLYRGGTLEQVTVDHTFVQRLVDSGRITQEEAAVHPRRSVLMRVLGDVDANPEIDTAVVETEPGDRWMLCSDGLSSYVSDDKIEAALRSVPSPKDAADRLVREALDQGAPDNVTIVIVDVDTTADSASSPPVTVGSAAMPLTFESTAEHKPLRLPTLLLHPLKAAQHEDSHFEPESDEYLRELIQEDKRRATRRRVAWLLAVGLIAALIVAALVVGYRWTQTRYYVGANGSTVAIYKGVQQSIGPLSLHEVFEETSIRVDSLSMFEQQRVVDTINADDLDDARSIITRLDGGTG